MQADINNVDGFETDFDEDIPHDRFKIKFNKEKYCKKNKIGSGKYGPHEYSNGRCSRCSKIDPQQKNKQFDVD